MRFATIAVAVVLLAGPAGAARETAAAEAVLDLTYRCNVAPLYDEVREVKVGVSVRKELPAVGGGTRTTPAGFSVGANRGGYGNTPLVGIGFGPYDRQASGYFVINRKACSELKGVAIPLTSRGLPSPPVLFEQYVGCPAAKAILVRFRGIVGRVPRWRRQGEKNLIANVNVSEAKFAVRAYSAQPAGRKPIAFVDVSRSGASRTFLAPRCD